MIVTELSLTNFRSYETAKFTFKPSINIIAGVNGAGKSTALDATRILMSRASREMLRSRDATVDVGVQDIRRGADFAYLAVEFSMFAGGVRTAYQFEGQVNREDFVPGKNKGDVRDEGTVSDPGFGFVTPKPLFHAPNGQPLCIFFSPHRSLLTQEASTSAAQTSAFAQALADRRFNLRQVAEWWVAQEALKAESVRFARRVTALEEAVQGFLPSSIHLIHPVPADEVGHAILLATKDRKDFSLFELSDGERGIVALVLEIARRLAIAYPDLDNPVQEGAACVLIDEIELHLHPQWQRDVLGWLTRTFPNCQFIVTTHSPQVIGEFEPDRVWYVAPGENPWQQDRSLGLDSSRVIEELMGGLSRNADTQAKLSRIAEFIDNDQLEAAKQALRALEAQLGENDPDVIRASGLIDFLEAPIDPD
jgi:energy-coupling factor transporter ATP-binding protein EcfA2